MAKKWEKLENDCFDYLKNNFKGPQYVPFGKEDSTKADIKVETKCRKFFIEVKSSGSQCCQFVLFPNEETQQFDFSSGNKVSAEISGIKEIINHMNNEFETYKKVNKAGINIPLNPSVFYGLVNDFYGAKSVMFFMTHGTDFIIFPKESFENYFDISACYRKKGSGSSEPNEKTNISEINEGLKRELSGDYCIEFCKVNKKKRCILHSDKNFNNKRILCDKYTYYIIENEHSEAIQKKKTHIAEIRRLSNTSNPNVICQLSLKKQNQDDSDLLVFTDALK